MNNAYSSRRGEYGQDLFSLRSMYLQGRPPPSVNMYWRRFAVTDMPLDDPEKFELWLRERWHEKDVLLEHYVTNGRFPNSKAATNGVTNGAGKDDVIETEVKLAHWWEVSNIVIMLAAFALVANLLARVYNTAFYGKQS
jgi:lysocardiolipin and lysophospholipid acyltransferase